MSNGKLSCSHTRWVDACVCFGVLDCVWGGLLKKNLSLTPDDIFGCTSKVRGRSVQAAYREPLPLKKKFKYPYSCVSVSYVCKCVGFYSRFFCFYSSRRSMTINNVSILNSGVGRTEK